MSDKCLIIVNDGEYFMRHKYDLLSCMADDFQFCVASDGDLSLVTNKFSTERIRVSRRLFAPIPDILLLSKLSRLIRNQSPKLIISFTLKPTVFTLLVAILPFFGLKMRTRIVSQLPGLGALFKNSDFFTKFGRLAAIGIFRIASRKLNMHLIFENKFDREYFVSIVGVKPCQTSVVSGTGLDLSIYRGNFPKSRSIITVLWACRLISGKGLDLYCAAAQKILRGTDYKLRFLVAGLPDAQSADSIRDSELKNMLEGSGVIYLGKVSRMDELLSSVDIICHPSRYNEGMPRVLLEAAAARVAIVASDNVGTRQFINHGVTGLLIDTLTCEGVTNELLVAIRNAELRRHLAENAFDLVNRGEFDLKYIAKVFCAIAKGEADSGVGFGL